MSASAQEFLMQIGRRSTEVTTDPRETAFLFQRVSSDSVRPAYSRHVPNF